MAHSKTASTLSFNDIPGPYAQDIYTVLLGGTVVGSIDNQYRGECKLYAGDGWERKTLGIFQSLSDAQAAAHQHWS